MSTLSRSHLLLIVYVSLLCLVGVVATAMGWRTAHEDAFLQSRVTFEAQGLDVAMTLKQALFMSIGLHAQTVSLADDAAFLPNQLAFERSAAAVMSYSDIVQDYARVRILYGDSARVAWEEEMSAAFNQTVRVFNCTPTFSDSPVLPRASDALNLTFPIYGAFETSAYIAQTGLPGTDMLTCPGVAVPLFSLLKGQAPHVGIRPILGPRLGQRAISIARPILTPKAFVAQVAVGADVPGAQPIPLTIPDARGMPTQLEVTAAVPLPNMLQPRVNSTATVLQVMHISEGSLFSVLGGAITGVSTGLGGYKTSGALHGNLEALVLEDVTEGAAGTLYASYSSTDVLRPVQRVLDPSLPVGLGMPFIAAVHAPTYPAPLGGQWTAGHMPVNFLSLTTPAAAAAFAATGRSGDLRLVRDQFAVLPSVLAKTSTDISEGDRADRVSFVLGFGGRRLLLTLVSRPGYLLQIMVPHWQGLIVGLSVALLCSVAVYGAGYCGLILPKDREARALREEAATAAAAQDAQQELFALFAHEVRRQPAWVRGAWDVPRCRRLIYVAAARACCCPRRCCLPAAASTCRRLPTDLHALNPMCCVISPASPLLRLQPHF